MDAPLPQRPSRRDVLGGFAAASLGSLLAGRAFGEGGASLARGPHFPAKAKHVIWLHMAGSPSQLDLFDEKPKLRDFDRKPIPPEFVAGERFAFIEGTPKVLASPYAFARHGECGANLSELLPHTAAIADKLTIVRSMVTDQFNHTPAQIFLNTGSPVLGRPSVGAWLSYGLGSECDDLPAFVVMLSGAKGPSGGTSLWGSGFLPTVHQGVRLRGDGDPVLYLSNPPGVDDACRRRSLDALRALNERRLADVGDPEIETRIAQYDLSLRMQASVPALADLASESQETLDLYGVTPGESGFARNALLARRLVERGVRHVHLYHWGWDSHGTSPGDDLMTSLPQRCLETDRASAALVTDLERRGLLDETIVVWGGEFGRTPMNEARNGSTYLGRDHHPHAFSIWLAGGGFRPGLQYGATDELGYFVVEDPLPVHDLHATLLHQLGIDHEKLTYFFQGRDFRLTDVAGKVVTELLA
ncbi:MAG: DUF1501 domain-containing protein [Planctomycetes bacterium]|nr:DUF1501 domain-containing protein [Planctomycetota bacterium]